MTEVFLEVPDSYGNTKYTDDEMKGIIEAIQELVIDVESMSAKEIADNMMALEVAYLEEPQCGKFFKEYKEVSHSVFTILYDNLKKKRKN